MTARMPAATTMAGDRSALGLALALLGSSVVCASACERPSVGDNVPRTHADMLAAVEHGARAMSWAADFDRTFPGAEHGISYYTGDAGPRTWYSKVGIGGRYHLTMRVRIDLDATGRRVTPTGPPRFTLVEVREITIVPDGGDQQRITYDPEGQVEFGADEWARLVAAHGDLSAVGVVVKTDPPVPGFEKPWTRM